MARRSCGSHSPQLYDAEVTAALGVDVEQQARLGSGCALNALIAGRLYLNGKP